jgi:hypothetical protein
MTTIPLDVEKRFEQRWAARFSSPPIPPIPKSTALKASAPRRPRQDGGSLGHHLSAGLGLGAKHQFQN